MTKPNMTIEQLLKLRTKTGEHHLEGAEFEKILDEMIVLKRESARKDSLIDMLQTDARSDPLTGLANRRAFDHELERSIATSRRYDRIHALLLIDIDNFKTINDQLGHLEGDAVLRHISTLLRQNIRKTDIAARIGGDEFCIILNELKARQNGFDRADAIASVIANTPYIGQQMVKLSVSVGCYVFGADDDAETIMHQADTNMYAQKAKQKATNA